MEAPFIDNILSQLRDALERDDVVSAATIIESLRPHDQAEVFSELRDEQQIALLPELDPTDSADIMEKLDNKEAADLAANLSTDTLVRIVDEMEPDEAADLLGDIDPQQAQTVLAGLVDPDEIHPLLLHADETAGGLMTSEFLALRRRMTAAEALAAFRAWEPDTENIYHLFVVDAYDHLVGVVTLRQIIIASPNTIMADIMDPEVISVTAGVDQEECARLMSRYDLFALPVIDAERKLLGVVTIDDVVDVLVEEATEDIQRMGGASPLDRAYLDSSVLFVTRKRINWLLLLFLTESLTGTVLRYFEGELQSVVALTFFIPLLIGTGGNAGSQTTSTIIRAVALGEIEWSDALHALWHEFRVGLLLGAGMALIAFFRALTWGSSRQLALTVSIAIMTIVMWANVLGSLLPLIATRLRIDPTVVSGPVMSTLVDATGLFIYFTIARFIIGL
jgi:magnesium transporter